MKQSKRERLLARSAYMNNRGDSVDNLYRTGTRKEQAAYEEWVRHFIELRAEGHKISLSLVCEEIVSDPDIPTLTCSPATVESCIRARIKRL